MKPLILLMLTLVIGCYEKDSDHDQIYFDAEVRDEVDAIIEVDSMVEIDSAPPVDDERIKCARMSNKCTSEYGSLFTDSNGRADGTLLALLETTDSQCDGDNDDHVVLQISILGEVQRLVVSVADISIYSTNHPLIGPEFSEGWHVGMSLDYTRHLDAHSSDFRPATMREATQFICNELEVGAPISVYAYSDGTRPDSAHQIHRNNHYPDGAVVGRPTSDSPIYLLFRYENQFF